MGNERATSLEGDTVLAGLRGDVEKTLSGREGPTPEAMIRRICPVKRGVELSGVHEDMVSAVYVARQVLEDQRGPDTCRVTSGTERPEGSQNRPSFHPIGYGVDIGARDVFGTSREETSEAKKAASEMSRVLGSGFRVIYETDIPGVRVRHFHIQRVHKDSDAVFQNQFGVPPVRPAVGSEA